MTIPAAAPARWAGREVEGVLFDVDDTLIDTRAAFRHALAAAFEAFAPGATARAEAIVTQWRRDASGYYRAYTRGELGYHAQRRMRADQVLAALGAPAFDDDGYAAWSDEFDREFARAWRAWPDTGALAALAAAGLRLGALSNAPCDIQAAKLAATGLGPLVPLLVGIDTLGVGKPEPEVFLEGCRRLGTAPARTAYVGDELDIDALAAARTGLVGVWVRRPGREEVGPREAGSAADDVLVVDSLTELAALTTPAARPAARPAAGGAART